jgi:hypothetical protein
MTLNNAMDYDGAQLSLKIFKRYDPGKSKRNEYQES